MRKFPIIEEIVRAFILILFFFISIFVDITIAQVEYQVFYLSNYNKLPTNFVKATVQDSLGFLWFATDNGLARYDGENIKVFDDAFNSKFVKNFNKKDNDIYILSDDGISLLKIIGGKHSITPFIQGSTVKADSKVFYPKEMFFDRKNNIWISEPTSILKITNGKIKRYDFKREDFTQSYTRSFNLIEDRNGRIVISSQRGNIFYYDARTDSIEKIPFKSEFNSSIDAFIVNKKNQIIAGGSEGLFEIIISDDYSSATFTKLSDIRNVSVIKTNSKGEYFIGTWSKGLYYTSDLSKQLVKISELKFDIISNIYIANDETIWINSDEGVAFLKKLKFKHIVLSPNAFFIQSLKKSRNNIILSTEGNSVFEIQFEDGIIKAKSIYDKTQSLIRSVCGTVDNLWIGFSDGFLINKKNNKTHFIDLTNQISGDNIVYHIEGINNNLWGILGRTRGIFRVDENYNVKIYDSFKEISDRVNVLKKSKEDKIYVGCNGIDSYLFRYNEELDKFEDISKPLNIDNLRNFEVIDLDFDSKGNIWLATNIGLIKFSDAGIEYIDELNHLINSSLTSIAIDTNNNIWIGTESGFLFYENRNLFTFFNENSGIPNATNTLRTAAIDEHNRVIFGTAKGLIYQNYSFKNLGKTPKPILFLQKQDSIAFNDVNYVVLKYGQTLNVRFNSFTYPKEKILYQYRIINLKDTWSKPSSETELILSELSSGEYTLEIRAIEQGKAWSDVTKLSFVVEKPFYLSYYAIVFYFLLIVVLVFFAIKYYELLSEKNKFKEQLNHFFKVTNHILFITDTYWNLIYVNPYGIEFFNLQGKYSNKKFWEIFPEKIRNQTKEKLENISSSSSKISFVSQIEDKDKRCFFYQFNISKSSDEKLFYINASDVSEIKKLELNLQENISELQKTKALLQELNANKDKLFSIIAHDLKGPFLGLFSLTDMVLENYQNLSKEEIIETLRKLNSSINKTFNLTKNLLDWSLLQLNSSIFSPAEVNIKNAVDDTIKILSSRIEEKNIIVKNKIENDFLVKADKTMLDSVLNNLIYNSIKFTKSGGEIIVNAKDLGKGFLEVSVKDTGIGIPNSLKGKLFKISEKVSRKGTNGEESTGLGLILCKEFVERNGGEIRFESEENKGTTFYFTLPLIN